MSLPPLTPAVKLIAICTGGAYLLEILWVHWIAAALSPEIAAAGPNLALAKMHLALHPPDVMSGYIWQLLTYMLLHDPFDPFHCIFNIVFCWMFGAEFELRWGSRRFLRFYLVCGAIAGVFVLLWSAVVPGDWGKLTLGSSGAVYALFAAYAVIFPNRTLWPIPIKVKTFVWILVGLTVLYFLIRSEASFAAHMGGLIAGWLLTTGNWRPRRLLDHLRLWQLKRRRSQLRVVQKDDEGAGKNGRILH